MKYPRFVPAVAALVLLAGCAPSVKGDAEVVQDEKKNVEKTIIPSLQLDDSYYKTLVPYKESKSRGIIVNNLNTKYDISEAETGLMRLSQKEFPTDKFFYQDGQMLDSETVSTWQARANQTEEGLNPSDEGMSPEQKATEAPIYLAHIIEQNYLTRTDDNKVALSGVSVGLALNSIYYYQKEQYGEYYEEPIPTEKLEEEGKRLAAEIVMRLRSRDDLKEVPIVVGLFKQNAKNDIVPGAYFSYGVASTGSDTIGDWKAVDEEHVLFPTTDSDERYRDMNTRFLNFKQEVDRYFSNSTSVIGKGYFQNKEPRKMVIEIPIQFFSKSEVIGFTQYLTGLLPNHFQNEIITEIRMSSMNGPEALIIKKPNDSEPYVHIYE